MKMHDRAKEVANAVHDWLDDKSGRLREAVRKTVEENLFPNHDISFSLNHIRDVISDKRLRDWLESSLNNSKKPITKQTILCLHAGNLPMVGFQDVIAVLLSGHRYFGKLSKKDPYVLKSFLDYLHENNIVEDFCCSTEISELPPFIADKVMFSGSGKNALDVISLLKREKRTDKNTRFLIRTAHASAVWFDMEYGGWNDLIEAIFRYEGRGCRSVATIFTPNEPSEILNLLEQKATSFLTKNPPAGKPKPLLNYRQAYNQAIRRPSVVLGNILIQESEPDLRKDHLVTVQKASRDEARIFMDSAGAMLQSMYTNIPVAAEFEPLDSAQKPPINWKPDGVDSIEFLLDE